MDDFITPKVELPGSFRSHSLRATIEEPYSEEHSKMTEDKVWGIGFREEAGYIVSRLPLDGDPSKIEYVNTTPDVGSGNNAHFKPGLKNAGRAVKPDNVPTKAVWNDKKYPPYDFFVLTGMILVSDVAKDIIEGFEPGVHQFFPIEVIYKDGSSARQMYFFNICTRLEGIDRERTTAENPRGIYWDPRSGDFIFSKELIGEHHVWIDKHVHAGHFFSDQLKTALQQAEVSGISFNPFPVF